MISVNHPAVTNAHIWLREKYNVPEYETIVERFCEEFNCDVEWTDYYNPHYVNEGFIEFSSKNDELNFILRWA